MTIRARLFLTSAIVTALILVMGITAYYAQDQYNDLQNNLKSTRNELKAWVMLNAQVNKTVKLILKHAAFKKKDLYIVKKLKQIEHWIDLIKNAVEEENEYVEEEVVEDSHQRIEQIEKLYSEAKPHLMQVTIMIQHEHYQPAITYYMKHMDRINFFDRFQEIIEAGIAAEDEDVQRIEGQLNNLNLFINAVNVCLGLLSLMIVAFILARINNSIMKSLDRAQTRLIQGITDVGAGNFETQLEIHGQDEMSTVLNSFNQMSRALRESKQIIAEQQKKMLVSSKLSALGEMAAGLAHEINNPLAILSTVSEQLEEVLQDEKPDKDLIQTMGQEIRQTVKRIAKIVNGLRAVSRDGGNDPMVKIDVKKVIQDALTLCQERFRHNNVPLRLKNCENSVFISGRETQLGQVLLNMLNNAFDAIAALPERWVEISLQESENSVEIQILDSGQGIPEHLQEKLFQPFFTTKEVGKGTGLGLSISKGIIESHKGTLKIDSANKHTAFVITLPKLKNSENKNAA